MKTKQGFLTVREFAEQRGVKLQTVYRWLLDGKLPEIAKQYGSITLIPESYLSLVIDREKRGRKQGTSKPPPPLLTRKERFDRTRKIHLSFDDLQRLFEEGKTFREIGDMAGVSFQAIQSIYSRHFAHLMLPGWERRRAIVEKEWEEKHKAHLDEVKRLAILTKAARKVGYEVEPIKCGKNLRRCYKDRILINGKLCRTYYSAVPVSMSDSGYRLYYRVSVSRSASTNSDFIIALVGEGPYGIFIFPSKVILDQFEKGKKYKMFYIPNEYQAPYNNQFPKVDWWDYEEAWGRLKESDA